MGDSEQCGEHRYSNSGSRYFPQKSTNFTCSTLAVKYTPEKRVATRARPCAFIKTFTLSSGQSPQLQGQPLEHARQQCIILHVRTYQETKCATTEQQQL